jgi:hypothetical protein
LGGQIFKPQDLLVVTQTLVGHVKYGGTGFVQVPRRLQDMNRMSMPTLVLGAALAFAQSPPSTQLTLGVDRSQSITGKQLAAWQPIAQARIDGLCPGDNLQIFVIDAYTLTNRPLFDEALPPRIGPGATLNELLAFKQQVMGFKQRAAQALKASFQSSTPGGSTDIFSMFDRIPAAPSRRRDVVLFTDALHANHELNMERALLQSPAFPSVIQKLAAAHRWAPETLVGASVEFVLPSPDVNGPPLGPNDARTLREFYKVLAASLGGQLKGFETYLSRKGGKCDGPASMTSGHRRTSAHKYSPPLAPGRKQ